MRILDRYVWKEPDIVMDELRLGGGEAVLPLR